MWFLGIDIGTTHIKVVGVTETGTVLPPVRARTPVRHHQGLTFHDGDSVWSTVAELIKGYARSGPVANSGPLAGACIASFGQEESFPVDSSGIPLHPSLAWWERWPERSIADETAKYFDTVEHYHVSGMRLRDNQTPDRIAHLQKHEPDLWDRTHKWVDFGSYVAWKLTGSWSASSTQVTHSQFFDLRTLSPHVESLDQLGLPSELFAPVAVPGTWIGTISPEILEGVSLTRDASVFVGGHDQVLAAYATSISDSSNVIDSIGTAEYVMLLSDNYAPDQELYELGVDIEHGWSKDRFVLGWGLPTGKILHLLTDLFSGGDFDRLMRALSAGRHVDVDFAVNDLRATSSGLISIGRIPAGASGDDVVRSCVTQLSDSIRQTLNLMAEASGTTIESVALTGSLFQREEMVAHRQHTWRLPLRISRLDEAVATGAAEMARVSYVRDGFPLQVLQP